MLFTFDRGARRARGERFSLRSARAHRLIPVLLAACAANLAGQSRPLVAPAAMPIYQRLLPQIEAIKVLDHHAHPAWPDDPDVDIAPPPPGGAPLRIRDDNPETSAAARVLFGFPFGDMKDSHGQWLVDKKAALKK